MRALVVGGGSIGLRHLNNLRSLRFGSLAVVEPDYQRRQVLGQRYDVPGFETLPEGLEWQPDLVVIASPSHLHADQALAAARAGCHLFIEKPLSHNDCGLKELSQEVERRNLVTLVGCNMRFHPGPGKIKELLEQEAIGRVLFARLHTGSYLPEWRPEQDYRKSYSAQAQMGGGCILDCIHEIDLARWYLGEVERVFCLATQASSLEIEVEDVAALICQHAGSRLSEIHLDYVQRTYERGCQIVGERGSLFWDFRQGSVKWFEATSNWWTTFPQPEGWQVNQMYLEEMRHFLSCVKKKTRTAFPVPEAVKVMEIVLAAKASARSGCLTEIRSMLP